jgi:hypothetical protein
MRPALLTVEFWMTMVTNVVGLVVLFGGLSADKADSLKENLTVIIGAVLPLIASTVYAKSRSDLKRTIADATLHSLTTTDADGKVRTASVYDATAVLKRLGI